MGHRRKGDSGKGTQKGRSHNGAEKTSPTENYLTSDGSELETGGPVDFWSY